DGSTEPWGVAPRHVGSRHWGSAPRNRPRVDPSELPQQSAGTMNSQHRPRGCVLVVDDEPIIREVVSRYLDRAGYETRVACDGPQALQMAAEHRPDLVVLDVMLPGLGGLEVMSRLRDSPRERTAVVLL